MFILINKHNNTYHNKIKMRSVDVNTYANSGKEINNEDPKFKISDFVRTLKYKNIFAKGYFPNWSEDVSVIKKVKNTVSWTYVISVLKGEQIVETFYEKELQKANQKEIRVEKVTKRKSDKLYVNGKATIILLTVGLIKET